MNISKISAITLLLILSIVNSGCGKINKSNNSKPKNNGNAPEINNPVTEKTSTAVVGPNSLRVYLDASGSMKGYVQFPIPVSNASIKDVVPSVLTNAEIMYKDNFIVVCKTISNNRTNDYPRKDFPSKLIDGSIFSGTTTEFDKILELVVKETKATDVSMIVSDCVMSFGSAALKIDPNKNVNNIDILKDNIKISLNEARTKKLTIALIKYESDFNGKYYYSCREEVPVNYSREIMKGRPFYLCLIGKAEYIESMVSKGIFPEHKGIYFFNTTMQNPDFKIFRKRNSVGITKIEGSSIYSDTPAKQKTNGCFYIGIKDITVSPIFDKDKDKILKMAGSNNKFIASVDFVTKSTVSDDSNDKGIENYKLFYKVTLKPYSELKDINDVEDNISFKPVQSLDVIKSSIFPDSGKPIKDLEGKTFAFNKIIEGIEGVFLGIDPSVAKITIAFKKE